MKITIFLIAGFTYLADASLHQSRLGYRKRVRGSKRVEFGRFLDAKVEELSVIRETEVILKRTLLDLSYGNGNDVFMSYGKMSIPYQPGSGMSLANPSMSFPYQQGFSLYYSNLESKKDYSLSASLSPSLLISEIPLDANAKIMLEQDPRIELKPLSYTVDSSISLLLDVEFQADDHLFNDSMVVLQDEIVSQGVSYFPLFRGKHRSLWNSIMISSDDERFVTGLEVNISSLHDQQLGSIEQCKPMNDDAVCIVVNMTMKIYSEEGQDSYNIKEAVIRGFRANIVNQMLAGTLSSSGILAIRLHDRLSHVRKDFTTGSSATALKHEQDVVEEEEMPSDHSYEISRVVGTVILVASTIFFVLGIMKKFARK